MSWTLLLEQMLNGFQLGFLLFLIAAGLTPTTARREQFHFGPHYQQVTEEVVCRRGGPRAW